MGQSCNCSENVSSNNADLSQHRQYGPSSNGPKYRAMQDSLNTYFPGAMRPSEVERISYNKLKQLGFRVDNTLFADSTCPDEINHDAGLQDITSQYFKRWGEIFPLGGLGGLPFTGQTGWGAFSSHCPDDGHIVIMFSPHVGVDRHGEVGKINRCGQSHTSSACGAAIGALKAIKEDPSNAQFKSGPKDFQMDFIKHLLAPHVRDIDRHENEQVALAFKMYEIISSFVDDVTNLNFGGPKSKLAIIGGITINCDGEGNDLFLPMKFELRTKDKRGGRDLFSECFTNFVEDYDYSDNKHSGSSHNSNHSY